MKTNAIVRIIFFSLAILVLAGILIAGLGVNLFTFDTKLSEIKNEVSEVIVSTPKQGSSEVPTTSGTAAQSDAKTSPLPTASDGLTTQTVTDAGSIRNLDIDWVSGTITIQPDENAVDITVAESYVDNTKYQMAADIKGNTLKIQYCRETITFPSFGMDIDISKDLYITVPAGWVCNDLEIDAAAANVVVEDLTINEVDFDGASGNCEFINCTVGELDVDGASGDIRFSGELNALDFDGASANCVLVLTNSPREITMDGMSGSLDLTLPESCGFTVTMEGLSTEFTCDFPTTLSGKKHVYGDGRCRISFGGLSGELTIRKGE